MSEQSITNQFKDGLSVDLDITAMGTTSLTDAKNATFLTYNGNECVLQNDMGNTRLVYKYDVDGVQKEELVTLPEGYIPLGVKEHGGVIYFVLRNEKDGRTQIGSFPSPEFKTNDSASYTGDPNTLQGNDNEVTKLHPTDKNTKNDCVTLVSDSERRLNPTQSIQNYMFKDLNTAYISQYNPATDDYEKRLLRPKFINTTYQQDITDFLKEEIDFNSCIWHVTVEGEISEADLKGNITIQVNKTENPSDVKNNSFHCTFEAPFIEDKKLTYKKFTTLSIPIVKEKEDSNSGELVKKYVPIDGIKISYTGDTYTTEFDELYFQRLFESIEKDGGELADDITSVDALKTKYYGGNNTELLKYICKSINYPNVKSGLLGMDLVYEKVDGVYVKSTKGKDVYYRPVLMDPTSDEESTDNNLLEKVKNAILSARKYLYDIFKNSINDFKDKVYYNTKTIRILNESQAVQLKSTNIQNNQIELPKTTLISVYSIPIYLNIDPSKKIGEIYFEYNDNGLIDDNKLTEDTSYRITNLGNNLQKSIYTVKIDQLLFNQPSDVKVDKIDFQYEVYDNKTDQMIDTKTIEIDYLDNNHQVTNDSNLEGWQAYNLDIEIPLSSGSDDYIESFICFASKSNGIPVYGSMFTRTDTVVASSDLINKTPNNKAGKPATMTPQPSTVTITTIKVVPTINYTGDKQTINIYSNTAEVSKNFRVVYGWQCYNNKYDIDLSYLNLQGLEFDASKEYSTYRWPCQWKKIDIGTNDLKTLKLLNQYIIDNNQKVDVNLDYKIDLRNTYSQYFNDKELEEGFNYLNSPVDIYSKLNPIDNDYSLFKVPKNKLNDKKPKGNLHTICYQNSGLYGKHLDHSSCDFYESSNYNIKQGPETTSYLGNEYTEYREKIYNINTPLNICSKSYTDNFLYNLFSTTLELSQSVDIKLKCFEKFNTTESANYFCQQTYIQWNNQQYKVFQNQGKDSPEIDMLDGKDPSNSKTESALQKMINNCQITFNTFSTTSSNNKNYKIGKPCYNIIENTTKKINEGLDLLKYIDNNYNYSLPSIVLISLGRVYSSGEKPGWRFDDDDFKSDIDVKLELVPEKNYYTFKLTDPKFDLSKYSDLIQGKTYSDILQLAYINYGENNKIYFDFYDNMANEFQVDLIASGLESKDVIYPVEHQDWRDFRDNPDNAYRSCLYEEGGYNRYYLKYGDVLNFSETFSANNYYLVSFYTLKDNIQNNDNPVLDIRTTIVEDASSENQVSESNYIMLDSLDESGQYVYMETKTKHLTLTGSQILSKSSNEFNYVRVSFIIKPSQNNSYLGLCPAASDKSIKIRNIIAVNLGNETEEDVKQYLHVPRARVVDTSDFLAGKTVGSYNLSDLWQDTQILPLPFYDITETFKQI